jgi:glycogen debranching enzyme
MSADAGGSELRTPSDIGDALTTKSASIFALAARDGDVDSDRNSGYGVYFHDTRFLDRSILRLNGQRLAVLLSESDGAISTCELTNPEMQLRSEVTLSKNRIGIRRQRHLSDKVLETVRVSNYGPNEVEAELQYRFGAEFESMFAIRGYTTGRRGELHQPRWEDGRLCYRYDGADGRRRTTAELCDEGQGDLEARPPVRRRDLLGKVTVETDNPLFNRVLDRSFADLRTLVTRQKDETYFAAGVPWFVALFGRDSIVTSLQTLAYDPSIAANTLELLAKYQGMRLDDYHDEEPGKILHELRVGEMAQLGEVPQTPYYGTADATPLFITLMAEYLRWTADLDLWKRLRPNVARALRWIDDYGDTDGDGFVDYKGRSSRGSRNQGWKDSGNSIRNRDGSLAEPPIALVEVQAYVYRARLDAAWLFEQDGDDERAASLKSEAEDLRRRFLHAFWMPSREYLAVALQKAGRQVECVTSNPGQALWSGIVSPERASAVVRMLMDEAMFSGWGVRTVARGEAAYNPIDYQVGAVWPHDNSLVAAGLKRCGHGGEASRIFSAIFDAATHFEQFRLPEVFAGIARDEYPSPVRYPVACSPQAWSAGALPYLLQTALGLEADAPKGQLRISHPELPAWLEELTISGLAVGEGRADLEYRRLGERTYVAVKHREGELDVHILE